MKCPVCKEEFEDEYYLGRHLMAVFGLHEYTVEEIVGMLCLEIEKLADRVKELERRITFGGGF